MNYLRNRRVRIIKTMSHANSYKNSAQNVMVIIFIFSKTNFVCINHRPPRVLVKKSSCSLIWCTEREHRIGVHVVFNPIKMQLVTCIIRHYAYYLLTLCKIPKTRQTTYIIIQMYKIIQRLGIMENTQANVINKNLIWLFVIVVWDRR